MKLRRKLLQRAEILLAQGAMQPPVDNHHLPVMSVLGCAKLKRATAEAGNGLVRESFSGFGGVHGTVLSQSTRDAAAMTSPRDLHNRPQRKVTHRDYGQAPNTRLDQKSVTSASLAERQQSIRSNRKRVSTRHKLSEGKASAGLNWQCLKVSGTEYLFFAKNSILPMKEPYERYWTSDEWTAPSGLSCSERVVKAGAPTYSWDQSALVPDEFNWDEYAIFLIGNIRYQGAAKDERGYYFCKRFLPKEQRFEDAPEYENED
jgi:hypothetical protein